MCFKFSIKLYLFVVLAIIVLSLIGHPAVHFFDHHGHCDNHACPLCNIISSFDFHIETGDLFFTLQASSLDIFIPFIPAIVFLCGTKSPRSPPGSSYLTP